MTPQQFTLTLVAVLGGFVVNALVLAFTYGRFSGDVNRRFISVERDIAEVKSDNKDQWKQITENGQAVSNLQGAARAARAGRT